MIATDSPAGSRLIFTVIVVAVIVWTYKRVGSVEGLRIEFKRRLGITVSRRFGIAWLALGGIATVALLTYLAFYLAGQTG
jgi:hypothetical protein